MMMTISSARSCDTKLPIYRWSSSLPMPIEDAVGDVSELSDIELKYDI